MKGSHCYDYYYYYQDYIIIVYVMGTTIHVVLGLMHKEIA